MRPSWWPCSASDPRWPQRTCLTAGDSRAQPRGLITRVIRVNLPSPHLQVCPLHQAGVPHRQCWLQSSVRLPEDHWARPLQPLIQPPGGPRSVTEKIYFSWRVSCPGPGLETGLYLYPATARGRSASGSLRHQMSGCEARPGCGCSSTSLVTLHPGDVVRLEVDSGTIAASEFNTFIMYQVENNG